MDGGNVGCAGALINALFRGALDSFILYLTPFDLKYSFADFCLIGVRAAPDHKVILRPLEQNLAPERRNKHGCFKRSLRGGLFCVPHHYCRWLD
jgi:hypothetical protein